MSNKLTHISEDGKPQMVDVSDKKSTHRTATAMTKVILPEKAMETLKGNALNSKKGSVIDTATIAGVMASKKTSELIPFCHQLNLTDCKISVELDGNNFLISCTAKTTGQTGVEMEALTGASITALTIYDMCKALTHDIVITETKLISKTGGKSDFKRGSN